MRSVIWVFIMCVWVSIVPVGCETTDDSRTAGDGSAAIQIRSFALSATDIARVVLTVSGDGISPDIVLDVPENPADTWTILIEDIPAGENRTFSAEAYDATNTLVYAGSAAGITVEGGISISVMIQLHEVNPPPPFDNAVPIIDALAVSPMDPGPGEEVSLIVEASDANPGDILTYEWTVTGGVLSDTASPNTVWTTADSSGTYAITIAVSDSHASTAVLSVDIDVRSHAGGAEVHIILGNSSPEVTGLIPTPTRIDTGESTQLSLTVSDSDGDDLTFEWSAGCEGAFNDNTLEDPIFTIRNLTGETCTLSVTVVDGNGGTDHAAVAIETGPPFQLVPPPSGCTGAIVFSDSNLEGVVREAIGKPTGNIYYNDLIPVTSLDANELGISDLNGIQCLNYLTYLNLSDNDLSWQYVGIDALATLTELTRLDLSKNEIADIGPLANLTSLTHLDLGYNSWLSDLRDLTNLTNLIVLNLAANDLSDFGILPIAGFPNLNVLNLSFNSISDISPLVANSGIDRGDHVDIRWNPLYCEETATLEYIAELEGRGVRLDDSCN